MPRGIVQELGKWQETARQYDERFNPPQTIDPAVVAAREKALREAQKKRAGAKMSRSQRRKQEFLAREAVKEKRRLQEIKITPEQRQEMARRQALMYQMMNLLGPGMGPR